jgi:hypothetical protein
MNGKSVMFGSIGLVGLGGLLYMTINNRIDKQLHEKREIELREMQKEWHHAGWNGGYEAGKRDAELEAMIKSSKDSKEV